MPDISEKKKLKDIYQAVARLQPVTGVQVANDIRHLDQDYADVSDAEIFSGLSKLTRQKYLKTEEDEGEILYRLNGTKRPTHLLGGKGKRGLGGLFAGGWKPA